MNNTSRTLNTFLSTLALGTGLLLGSSAQAESVAPRPGVLAPMLTAAPALEGKLNINAATQDQWELLPGIGPSTAKKLVAYRAKRKFGDILHVMRIKGIGRKTFEQIKPFLVLSGETTLHAARGK